jgi:hypothetical protein
MRRAVSLAASWTTWACVLAASAAALEMKRLQRGGSGLPAWSALPLLEWVLAWPVSWLENPSVVDGADEGFGDLEDARRALK